MESAFTVTATLGSIMCGVAGAAARGPAPQAATKFSLSHRGPDAERTVAIAEEHWHCLLYHSRLSINDLSDAGLQPMQSACGSGLCLSFNGEIYNAPELRSELKARGHHFNSEMDGEVILHLYEDLGVKGFSRLRGIFAIALADPTGEIILTRDALGVKPLYYWEEQSRITFASEVSALTSSRHDAVTWDPRALAAFLTFLWIPAPWTPFKEVRSLRPGEVLRWRADEASTSVRVGPHGLDYPSELEPKLPPNVAAAELGERLDQAIDRQLLSDVPIGMMASGGVDSTLIWSEASHSVKKGYTVAERAGPEGLDADFTAASRFAFDRGLRVQRVSAGERVLENLPTSGDLIADPAYGLANMVSRAAHQDGIRVLLSGQGADEILGGYRRHQAAHALFQWPSFAINVPSRAAARSWNPMTAEYGRRLSAATSAKDAFSTYSELYKYSDADQRARLLGTTSAEVSDDIVLEEHRRAWEALPSNWPNTKKAIVLDLAVYLPGLGLSYVDRASMREGVEVRVPWLDEDIVAWSLGQDPRTLVDFRNRKKPALELSRRRLPAYVWDRPKVGFAVDARRLRSDERSDLSRRRHAGYLSHADAILQRYQSAFQG